MASETETKPQVLVAEEEEEKIELDSLTIGRENWHAQRADWRHRPPDATPPTATIEKFRRSKQNDLETIQYELVSGRSSMRVPLCFLIEALVDVWEEESF